MVIRQSKAERIPARPLVIVMVFLVALALAISAAAAQKSTAPVHTQRGPAVVTTNAMSPDAQDRNAQILQSRNAEHHKITVQ